MTSEKFRRQLRQEAESWWNEGLIDAQLYGRLADRYQFKDIETNARSTFTTILISLGGILVGLGVITFVAANWTVWTRELKLAILLGLFLGVNITGFYLWRSRQRGTRKLGAALLLLGGLILGANLSLVSQMFHQSGNFYELLLVWGAGVSVMALSLAMPALSWLAILLVGSGYVPAITNGNMASDLTVYHLAALHMPVIVLVLFVPLAYRTQSKFTFLLAGLLFSASFIGNLFTLDGWAVELAIALPPALFWAYSVQSRQRFVVPEFQPLARALAVLLMAGSFYSLSFNAWMSFELDSSPGFKLPWGRHIAFDLLVCCALTIWLWLKLRHQLPRFNLFQTRSLNTGTVAVMLLVAGGTFYTHLRLVPIEVLGPILYNVLLFFLAIAAIRDGLALGSRRTFWGGMLLLVLGIVTRMLELDTELLTKAIVFSACGIGVILAGLWFERNIQQDDTPAPTQLQEENS